MKFKGFEELLRHNADKYGGRTAFAYACGNEVAEMNYSGLLDIVLNRAEELKQNPAGCVGVYEASGVKWAVDMFAAVLAGKQTVLIDPSVDGATLQKLVSYTDAECLLTDDSTAGAVDGIIFPRPAVPVKKDGEGDILFFTSGTTEASRAVVLTSKSLCASAWNGNDKLECFNTDNLLSVLPLSHVFGFVCSMLWPMSQGASVSFGRGLRFLADDCAFFKPSVISLVPSMLYFMLAKQALNPELRVILIGAGPAGQDALDAAKALGYEVRFGYGLTETSSGVAISTGDNPFAMTVCADSKITLGDDGEILIYCPECMMKGYYKFTEATGAVLKNGIFYSGDLGRFDAEGRLFIVGRKKDIIALPNGSKIYLPEWEAELKTAVRADEAAIVTRGNVITAVLVFGEPRNASEIQASLDGFNGSVPFDRQISAFETTAVPLPKTATGKLKRWAI